MSLALRNDFTTHVYPQTELFEQVSTAQPLEIDPQTESDTRPKTMDGAEEECVMEKFLRQRSRDDVTETEIKRKGWGHEDNTGKPRSQLLVDVPDMVAEFDSKSPSNGREPSGSAEASLSTTEDTTMSSSTSTQFDTMSTKWKGWAELENDPLIFTTLLREWGVQGVGVQEVIPLSAVFDKPVEATLGLIFLSRYVVFDQGSDVAAPSDQLWFANQISSYSCATIALMNIINNRSELQLGEDLQKFRARTWNLSPKDRGLALDSLEIVRDVHNSFATEIDRLYVDVRLKDDLKSANASKRTEKRKKGRQGRKKARISDEMEEESGLHFIAFVPVAGHLWRLDGLEREPTSIGRLNETNNWLMMVVPVLEAQLSAAAAMNQLEFSLLSVVLTDPAAVDEKDHERMRRVREDWGPMMATLVRIHAEKGDLASKLG